MTHISFCDLIHWFQKIFSRYPLSHLSHLSAQFYTYFLVRQAVIWVLVNVPSGSLLTWIPVNILYCMFHLLIWGVGGLGLQQWMMQDSKTGGKMFSTQPFTKCCLLYFSRAEEDFMLQRLHKYWMWPLPACLPLSACLIAWLHANRGECWLSGSFAPCYAMPDLIHCSEARAGIPSCTWKQAVGRREEWDGEEGGTGDTMQHIEEKRVAIKDKSGNRRTEGECKLKCIWISDDNMKLAKTRITRNELHLRRKLDICCSLYEWLISVNRSWWFTVQEMTWWVC